MPTFGTHQCAEEMAAQIKHSIIALGIFISINSYVQPKPVVYQPVIEGNWWNITSQPDLGKYTGDHQEPVDFAVWKANDGSWQLWSCIRGTSTGGNTRLFYKWEGRHLTDTAWTPKGIAMTADTTAGETAGGLQAPFVFKDKGLFQMVYGDWIHICRAESKDGKTFTRVLRNGSAAIFSGPLHNTRDPMVLKVGHTYYCYYCGHNKEDNGTHAAQGAVFCRTSSDLVTWTEPVAVASGGSPLTQTSWYGGDIECPYVVKIDSCYILFRNQRYGADNLNTQYCSKDPLLFGNNTDERMVGQLAIAAPEIIKDRGQYYIVALRPDLKGMRMAKLSFVRR